MKITIVEILMLASFAAWLGGVCLIGYIAWHFISKLW